MFLLVATRISCTLACHIPCRLIVTIPFVLMNLMLVLSLICFILWRFKKQSTRGSLSSLLLGTCFGLESRDSTERQDVTKSQVRTFKIDQSIVSPQHLDSDISWPSS